MANSVGDNWGLEVVRGRDVGRVFPLAPGPNVLGNALNVTRGVNLGDQEGTSVRRMAARHATVDRSPEGLSLLDLESPGGTFVNRQRVLPGQARRLEPGDMIQVGAVQLRVVAATAPEVSTRTLRATAASTDRASTPRPGSLATPFSLPNGATCRTWDDFLTASARSWTVLRDELTSGRLGSFLRTAGRDDLVPSPLSSKSGDERLDEWLGRLPTTRTIEPDLEVYPSVVRVRAPAGGGTVRSKVVITNTGYRLLRSSLRFEPPGTHWVRLPPTFANGPFTTAETTEVPFDVDIPESLTDARTAALVIDSNGGVRRVEVRVELPAKPELPPDLGAETDWRRGTTFRDALAGRRLGARVSLAYLALLGLRALILLGDLLANAANLDDASRPSLAGAAVVMAVVGGTLAGWLARRRGEAGDVAPGAFAGAFAGVLAAAVSVAACRAVEPALAGMRSLEVALLLAIGAVAGLISLRLVSYEPLEGEKP